MTWLIVVPHGIRGGFGLRRAVVEKDQCQGGRGDCCNDRHSPTGHTRHAARQRILTKHGLASFRGKIAVLGWLGRSFVNQRDEPYEIQGGMLVACWSAAVEHQTLNGLAHRQNQSPTQGKLVQ